MLVLTCADKLTFVGMQSVIWVCCFLMDILVKIYLLLITCEMQT